ncbi:MAG: hypothetical protein ABI986_10380 [Chloroflexota bacterium]
MRNFWAGTLRLLGAIVALVSCIPMLAMLPAGFATVLALLGLAAPPLVAWATPFAPIAPPLLILSVAILVIGNLRCGWQPASLAALGGLLVYLAMYVFVTPVAMDVMSGMQGMTSAETSQPAMLGLTNAPMFYVGLILMVGSFGLVLWRRWQKICRPFNPLAFLGTARQN